MRERRQLLVREGLAIAVVGLVAAMFVLGPRNVLFRAMQVAWMVPLLAPFAFLALVATAAVRWFRTREIDWKTLATAIVMLPIAWAVTVGGYVAWATTADVKEHTKRVRAADATAVLGACEDLMDRVDELKKVKGARVHPAQVELMVRKASSARIPQVLLDLDPYRIEITKDTVEMTMAGAGPFDLGLTCCRAPGVCIGKEHLGPGVAMHSR